MKVGRQATALGQLVRRQLGDQVLERSAVAVDAKVGEGARGKQPPQQVQGLRPGGRFPGAIGLPRLLRIALTDSQGRRLDEPAVGLEQRIHRPLVERVCQLLAAVIQEPPARPEPVETHVAGRLFQGRDTDAAVLNCFGSQHRHLLDRDVSAGQLRDRIVPVSDKDAFVKLFRSPHGHHVVLGRAAGQVLEPRIRFVDELVQEHPAKALLGSGVAGEEGAFHHLRKVAKGENGTVQVGEVASKDSRLGRVEFRRWFDCHSRLIVGRVRGARP